MADDHFDVIIQDFEITKRNDELCGVLVVWTAGPTAGGNHLGDGVLWKGTEEMGILG